MIVMDALSCARSGSTVVGDMLLGGLMKLNVTTIGTLRAKRLERLRRKASGSVRNGSPLGLLGCNHNLLNAKARSIHGMLLSTSGSY